MTERTRRVLRLVAGVTVAAAMMSVSGFGAQAQKAKAKEAAPQSAWVKLCEKAKLVKTDKAGKTTPVEKSICLTHHERLDGNTGMVIISAAIRVVEGQDKPNLMIMVPLGMALPAGVKAAVYNNEQWERARKKEKVDDKELKPISLKYTLCHPAGCTAEIPIPDGLLGSMEKGGGLMVLALNAGGRPVAFPVPLTGFATAHKGKPIDSQKYGEARAKLMQQIRARMRDQDRKSVV